MSQLEDGVGSLEAAVEATYAQDDSSHSLGHNQLRFIRTVALSVGIQGPVAGVIVGPAILASLVGGAGALAYLLGLVAMAFVAYAFVIFARSFNSSGSVYAFNGAALGPTYGFVSAWILLLVYLSFAAAVYASTADIAQTLLASLGWHVGWLVLALVGFVVTMIFAYRSIRVTTMVIFWVEGIAVVLLVIVGIVVVAHGGYHHRALSTSPFQLHGLALGVIGLGVVNAFGAFSGFEGAATLGEESRSPTKTIPAAIWWSLLGSAAIYIVFTWIANNAYPNSSTLAADPAPFVHLANQYVGSVMGNLVNAAGVISAFGAQLACIAGANRLIFALGRDVGSSGRFGRSFLTRTHPRFASPVGALAVSGIVSLGALLAFGFEASAIRALILIVQLGAYLIIVAYLMTVVAAVVWVWRHARRVVPLIILSVGVVVLALVLYDTFHPFPPAPFNLIVAIAVASIVAGVVFSWLPPVRTRLQNSELLRAVRRNPERSAT